MPNLLSYFAPARAQSGGLLATVWGRRVAFFLLYMTEGIPFGFTATAVTTQMRREGLGPAEIGVFIAGLYFPWAWKWVAGPVVDLVYSERLGRRRAWIVGCQVMMVATLLVAWQIDFSTKLRIFTLVILTHNIFAAVQDVAIDALAVGTLPKEERGLVNGLMFAGSYLGQTVGGAGVLFLAAWVGGFNMTFPFVCGALLVVTFLVSIRLREPRRAIPVDDAGVAATAPKAELVLKAIGIYVLTALKAMFGSVRAAAGLIFALLPAGAYGLSLTLQTNLAVEFGMPDERIALLAMFTTIIAAAGCIAGGWLSDRVGRRRAVATYVVLTAIPTFAFAWYMQQRGWIWPIDTTAATRPTAAGGLLAAFWTACLVYAFFQGLIYGGRTAMFMDLCNPAVAATQFTAYMAVMNLVLSWSAAWQGYAAERFGYPIALTLDASIGLVCLVALPFMTPPKAVEEPEPPKAAFEVL